MRMQRSSVVQLGLLSSHSEEAARMNTGRFSPFSFPLILTVLCL